ncbi:response regulator [Qipengyuania sp.]|uniref:response regulator n=1 Tax=Qipengyuania sp. TaxID=2004515 RepID=UPI0035156996
MRILVIEDDEILREGLTEGLALEGHTVDAVASCGDAREAAAGFAHDAIVLDIGLPDGSGLDLLREWRRAGHDTPVLLLTARNMTEDRIQGLDLGADDYMGKPFDLAELAARLRAMARRGGGRAEAILRFGKLEIDPAARRTTLDAVPINLSRREFAVLETLARRPGQIVSRSRIEEAIYGWQEEVGSNAVEVHIHKLRGKLGADTIETVRGLGYRLRSDGSAS